MGTTLLLVADRKHDNRHYEQSYGNQLLLPRTEAEGQNRADDHSYMEPPAKAEQKARNYQQKERGEEEPTRHLLAQ